jgi:hypothetical protein
MATAMVQKSVARKYLPMHFDAATRLRLAGQSLAGCDSPQLAARCFIVEAPKKFRQQALKSHQPLTPACAATSDPGANTLSWDTPA